MNGLVLLIPVIFVILIASIFTASAFVEEDEICLVGDLENCFVLNPFFENSLLNWITNATIPILTVDELIVTDNLTVEELTFINKTILNASGAMVFQDYPNCTLKTTLNGTVICGTDIDTNTDLHNLTDQTLNTTSNVTFNNITITDTAKIANFKTLTETHLFNFYSTADDLILNATAVEGNNYFSIATDGAFFQLYSNPNPSVDYLLATFTETQGADTFVNIYEGGTGHNRFYDSGSLRIGGNPSYLCSALTSTVDCDTPTSGADLVLEHQLWSGGGAYIANETLNITDEGNVSLASEINLVDDKRIYFGETCWIYYNGTNMIEGCD